jgi:hypothetical protein
MVRTLALIHIKVLVELPLIYTALIGMRQWDFAIFEALKR